MYSKYYKRKIGPEEKMKVTTVNLPPKLLLYVERLIEWGITPSRSEYIRNAVWRSIKEDKIIQEKVDGIISALVDDPDTIRIPNGDGTYSRHTIVRRLD